MDSALRPRDIQARIRAGASVEDVAEAAGVPIGRIEAFAAPVIAERDYICGLARTNPVRRRGETSSHRSLRNAVADTLAGRGVDDDAVAWDAWKLEDRRWQVQVAFTEADTEHRGLFVFDATGRFSVAVNDEAGRLIGESRHDDLALVHAIQDAGLDTSEDAAAPDADDNDNGDGDDAEDAFQESELEEIDGVYDIVPARERDLDVLFDMLSSFDEDSVKIYAGLVHPKDAPAADAPGPVVAETSADAAPPAQASPDGSEHPADVPPASAEPEQLSLIEEDTPPPAPKPRGRRKRAAVPSWDEIMFGSPRPDNS
ncbi:MAG: DUF3071 domain-containing protein [Nigerium sp.]|nr:DUF3071 domain-containing protein [Nigerium sp.]